MWILKNLIIASNQTQAKINGKYVPAKPIPPRGWYGFKIRISDAYKVLKGQADAFVWPENQ